jgi:MFS family permease
LQVFVAGEYYLPLYFQSVREASPLQSGLLTLPITVMEALTGIFVGVFIHRTGHFLELIYIGTVLATIGSGLYIHFSATSSVGMIIAFEIITAVGVGLLFEPPLLAIQATVPQDDVATATSTAGFVKTLAMAMSVVIGGVIFQNAMDHRVASLGAPPVSLQQSFLDLLSDGKAAANVRVVSLIHDPVQKLAVKQAFAWALRNMWIFYACLAGLCIVCSVFIERQHLSKAHIETRTGLKEKEPQSRP